MLLRLSKSLYSNTIFYRFYQSQTDKYRLIVTRHSRKLSSKDWLPVFQQVKIKNSFSHSYPQKFLKFLKLLNNLPHQATYIPVGYEILIVESRNSPHIIQDNCKPEDTLVTKDAHLKVVFKASTLYPNLSNSLLQ